MGWPTRLVDARRARTASTASRATGGCVLAINHLHWIDIPLVGVALAAQHQLRREGRGARTCPGLGRFLRWHGTIAVRRGESDRDAVRLMRAGGARRPRRRALRRGHAPARRAARARRSRARRWSRCRRTCRSCRSAIYGTQFWKLGNFAPCSVAFGEPLRFDGLPKGGRGYKEATVEIERRIHVLFDWLAERARAAAGPRGATPPL